LHFVPGLFKCGGFGSDPRRRVLARNGDLLSHRDNEKTQRVFREAGEILNLQEAPPEEDAIWIFLKDIHCRMLMPLSRYYKMNRHHLISQSAPAAG
jgi:hypothetical protein